MFMFMQHKTSCASCKKEKTETLNVNRIDIKLNQTDRLNNLKAPASHFLKFLCQPAFGTFAKPHNPTRSPRACCEQNGLGVMAERR
jgi:hypothetical protein